MDRADLNRRAVAAFLEYGRGAVVVVLLLLLLFDPERSYVRTDEAMTRLVGRRQ